MKFISRIILAGLLGIFSTQAYSKDSKKNQIIYQKNRLSDSVYLTKIKNYKYFYNCPFGELGTLLLSETESMAFPLFLTDLFDETLLNNKNVKMMVLAKTHFDKNTSLFSFQLRDNGDITGHHVATIDYQLHLNDLAEEIEADSRRTDSDNNQINISKQIKCTRLLLPKPVKPKPTSTIPVALTNGRWKTLADCYNSNNKQGTTYEYNKDLILIGKTYNIDNALTHIWTINTIIDTLDPYLFIFKGSQADLSNQRQQEFVNKVKFTENSYQIIDRSYNSIPDIANGYYLSNHEQTPVNYKCND